MRKPGAAQAPRTHTRRVERFRCAVCGTVFTDALRRVPMPATDSDDYNHSVNPPLLEPFTYAVDPDEYGQARLAGMYVLNIGNVRGMSLVPDRCVNGCWTLTGWFGPNEACDGCGTMVGHRTDDCFVGQNLRLDPDACVIGACDTQRNAGADLEPFPWEPAWSDYDAEHPELARTRWRGTRLAFEVLRDDPPGGLS